MGGDGPARSIEVTVSVLTHTHVGSCAFSLLPFDFYLRNADTHTVRFFNQQSQHTSLSHICACSHPPTPSTHTHKHTQTTERLPVAEGLMQAQSLVCQPDSSAQRAASWAHWKEWPQAVTQGGRLRDEGFGMNLLSQALRCRHWHTAPWLTTFGRCNSELCKCPAL